MKYYIITILALQFLALFKAIGDHGKPRKGTYDARTFVIAIAITWPIYFRALGWL